MLEYPVITPENVQFHYTLAGPGTRLAAWLIDAVVVSCLVFALAIVAGFVALVIGEEYTQAVLGVVAFVVTTGYWILLEHRMDGRTIGKRALGLRVIGEGGLRITLSQVILRNLMRFIDILPLGFGVGAVVSLFHPEHRRLGDLVAGTLVIRERRVPAPERIRLLAGGTAGAQPLLKLPGDLLRRVGPAERELLLDLAMRRDALDDGVRLRLFGEVAQHYRNELDLQEGDGLSDEKLVLLLTAAVYERLGAQQRA